MVAEVTRRQRKRTHVMPFYGLLLRVLKIDPSFKGPVALHRWVPFDHCRQTPNGSVQRSVRMGISLQFHTMNTHTHVCVCVCVCVCVFLPRVVFNTRQLFLFRPCRQKLWLACFHQCCFALIKCLHRQFSMCGTVFFFFCFCFVFLFVFFFSVENHMCLWARPTFLCQVGHWNRSDCCGFI